MIERRNEQINIHSLPGGTFISTQLQRQRLASLRNNSLYRENIEKAQRLAGSRDNLLYYSRGGRDAVMDALIRNTGKAENILHRKEKGRGNEGNHIICAY